MKIVAIFILSIISALSTPNNKDCGEAFTQAENGYLQTEKASMANNFDDQHLCLDKAITAYTNAINFAEKCGCDEALEEAQKALEIVQKARNGKTVDVGQKLSKKALEHAEEAMNLANDCSY